MNTYLLPLKEDIINIREGVVIDDMFNASIYPGNSGLTWKSDDSLTIVRPIGAKD